MGLEYAKNAIGQGWMREVRIYFFGPAEIPIATDPELRARVEELVAGGNVPHACTWCSDKHQVSDLLRQLGCVVEPIGAPVSEAIKAGYVPMTW